MSIDFRRVAVAAAGFSTFLHLYAPQALLPELAGEFGVGAAQINAMITASTLAIALTAPFTGAVPDVLGRKRLITTAMFAVTVPLLMATIATAPGTPIFWRFIEGLLLPPIFTVCKLFLHRRRRRRPGGRRAVEQGGLVGRGRPVGDYGRADGADRCLRVVREACAGEWPPR